MSRELKFRAWGKNIKEYMGDGKGACNVVNILGDLLKQGGWVIEQSTGFKDMNGNEIWVGDIIRDFDDEILIVETAGTAYVSDKTCSEQHWDDWEKNSRYSRLRCLEKLWLDTGYYKDAGTQIEVIGNIHENPELLKGGLNGDV